MQSFHVAAHYSIDTRVGPVRLRATAVLCAATADAAREMLQDALVREGAELHLIFVRAASASEAA